MKNPEIQGFDELENPLGVEIFQRVEATQGYAFLSDGISYLKNEQLFSVVRGALKNARKVVRILEKFLDEHDER